MDEKKSLEVWKLKAAMYAVYDKASERENDPKWEPVFCQGIKTGIQSLAYALDFGAVEEFY